MPLQTGSLSELRLTEFKQNLAFFPFSNFEIDVIASLLQRGPCAALDLKQNPKFSKKGPILTKTLTALVKRGWIEIIGDTPKKYTLVSRDSFQKKMDEEIEQSQTKFQEQKNRYYGIISFFKESQSIETTTSTAPSTISPKTPEFIKGFLENVLLKEQFHIIKSEPNIGVTLNKENIAFKLSSVEWEANFQNKNMYGGINFVEFESDEERTSLLPRIHQYNIDSLSFTMKMEKKGANEERKRKITDYSIDETSKKELSTNFHVKLEAYSLDGQILTFTLPKPKYSCTIWAESKDILSTIKSYINKYNWK